MARVRALSVQLNNLCGSETATGSHTRSPNPTSIIVSNRDASGAERPESSTKAASPNATVVAIAQNNCPGGIHFGTNSAVAERSASWSTAKETTQTQTNEY